MLLIKLYILNYFIDQVRRKLVVLFLTSFYPATQQAILDPFQFSFLCKKKEEEEEVGEGLEIRKVSGPESSDNQFL